MLWPKGECLAYNSTFFPNFWLDSPIFFIVLQIWLGLFHPSIASIPWCVCTHPIDLMGIHLLCCAHANRNPWCSSQHLCCHCTKCWLPRAAKITTCVSFKHVQLLLSMNWHCVHQRWHSHLNWRCHCRPNVGAHLFPRSCTAQRFATFDVAQAKNGAIVTD